jgi:DNA-binding MarR family transcriptional regulator
MFVLLYYEVCNIGGVQMIENLSMLQFKVMLTLKSNAKYGFQISNTINVDPGTVHHSIKGLQSKGLVSCSWEKYNKNSKGPVRKFCSLTKKGRNVINSECKIINILSKTVCIPNSTTVN